MALTLTADERTELDRRTRSRKIRAEDARRAKVILMLAAGDSFTAIAAAIGCYPAYIARWKARFETERLAGLHAKYRGQVPTVRTPALEARVLAKTRRRQHALDDAQAGQGAGHQPHARGPRVAPRGLSAALLRAVHALG